LLSLNTATKEQLLGLPGIGPVYAGSIIAYREQLRREEGRGFRSVDELLNVPGIGPRRLAGLRDRVVP
jgi:competence protein ComEA